MDWHNVLPSEPLDGKWHLAVLLATAVLMLVAPSLPPARPYGSRYVMAFLGGALGVVAFIQDYLLPRRLDSLQRSSGYIAALAAGKASSKGNAIDMLIVGGGLILMLMQLLWKGRGSPTDFYHVLMYLGFGCMGLYAAIVYGDQWVGFSEAQDGKARELMLSPGTNVILLVVAFVCLAAVCVWAGVHAYRVVALKLQGKRSFIQRAIMVLCARDQAVVELRSERLLQDYVQQQCALSRSYSPQPYPIPRWLNQQRRWRRSPWKRALATLLYYAQFCVYMGPGPLPPDYRIYTRQEMVESLDPRSI